VLTPKTRIAGEQCGKCWPTHNRFWDSNISSSQHLPPGQLPLHQGPHSQLAGVEAGRGPRPNRSCSQATPPHQAGV